LLLLAVFRLTALPANTYCNFLDVLQAMEMDRSALASSLDEDDMDVDNDVVDVEVSKGAFFPVAVRVPSFLMPTLL
jgi:hypothetical protein